MNPLYEKYRRYWIRKLAILHVCTNFTFDEVKFTKWKIDPCPEKVQNDIRWEEVRDKCYVHILSGKYFPTKKDEFHSDTDTS